MGLSDVYQQLSASLSPTSADTKKLSSRTHGVLSSEILTDMLILIAVSKCRILGCGEKLKKAVLTKTGFSLFS